jgi:hypothetical protein
MLNVIPQQKFDWKYYNMVHDNYNNLVILILFNLFSHRRSKLRSYYICDIQVINVVIYLK